MKRRILTAALVFIMLFVSATTASAWYLEFDNADGDNEIDAWFRVENGESIDLKQYDIGFFYDATELEFTSYTNNLPDGWGNDGWYPEVGYSNGGTVGMFGFYGVGEYGTFIFSEDYKLGSYTFTILEGAVIDGKNDVWFPLKASSDFSGSIGYMLPVSITANHDAWPNVDLLIWDNKIKNGSGLDLGASPVPVPAAVWLLGSGLLGLAGIRRKKA